MMLVQIPVGIMDLNLLMSCMDYSEVLVQFLGLCYVF
jgi:hypothetical protein